MSILFEQDWLRFPRAIADYDTKNESFKRIVSLYQRMGVQNCLFPLSLLQPELVGVDPYAENLSEETKVMIGMECRYNFWYFIREVVRIPPTAGPNPIMYKANRGNIALSWMFHNNIDFALIQPRQTGKSVSTDCISDWLIYIGASNTTISLLTKDDRLRRANVERLKKMRDLLPPYLINISTRDSDNQSDLTCLALSNKYITAVGQTSENAANNIGRGLSTPVQHIDEGPFIRFIGTMIPASLAGGTAAREEAKQFNRPHGNIFTTTAGKKDDRDGRYMYELIHNGAPWNEAFYDTADKPALVDMVKKNCLGRKAIINGTFNHRQLGKTDAWLAEQIAIVNASREEANRDFFNIWTSGTQSSPLTPEQNETIRNSEIDPVYTEISTHAYIIRWYCTLEDLLESLKNTNIILGLDMSDALGRDALALTFINARDLAVVGAATINETNLILFGKFLANVLIKYPNITLVPERKSQAQTLIDSLLIQLPRAGEDPFRRIFNQVVNQKDEKPHDFQEINNTPVNRRTTAFYDKWKKYFGFNTTGASRDLLYSSVFQNAARESAHLIHDRTLSDEIRGLIIKNGRIDHSNESHDDMVVAWLLAHWFLTHSKNLSYYGIDTGQLMTKVHGQGRVLTEEEEFHLERQEQIRQEIDDIYEQLKVSSDEYVIARLESKLFALNSRVEVDDSDALSIDALVQQAAEAREHSKRQRAIENRRNQAVRESPNRWTPRRRRALARG